jgi:hypothetical protein
VLAIEEDGGVGRKGVGAPPPTATRRLELDPGSLGGWAATLARRGVPLPAELRAAAEMFDAATSPRAPS